MTIDVSDASAAGEVRRSATGLAAGLEFTEEDQGRVALVATEVATNLVKHAKDGQVVLRSLSAVEGGGVELLALDRGPGIADLARCLRDGFSTVGTSGAGLGAIRRLADQFDVTSTPGLGTTLAARLRRKGEKPGPRPAAVDIGAVCLPVAGEEACGDAWVVESSSNRTA